MKAPHWRSHDAAEGGAKQVVLRRLQNAQRPLRLSGELINRYDPRSISAAVSQLLSEGQIKRVRQGGAWWMSLSDSQTR